MAFREPTPAAQTAGTSKSILLAAKSVYIRQVVRPDGLEPRQPDARLEAREYAPRARRPVRIRDRGDHHAPGDDVHAIRHARGPIRFRL